MDGAIAEEADQQLLIVIEYRRAIIDCWTRKIKGLHQKDFITAAKMDPLL